jgi:predicted MFS family arabinose efflux permease
MSAKTHRSQVIFYALAVFAYWASLYFYVPTLSVYAEEVTRDLSIVGTIISMYGLWQAVARYPLGIISDIIGKRKPFIMMGFALSAVGAFVMMRANGATGLIIGRGITGLSAAVWALIVVGFASLFPPEQAVRLAAVMNIVNAVGRTLATGINGTLNNLGGYDLAFIFGIAFSVLAIAFFLPVKDTELKPRKPNLKAIAKLTTRPDVLFPSLLAALVQFVSTSAIFTFVPILARSFGASDNHISFLTMGNIVISVLGNLLISVLTARIGNRPVLMGGFACMGIGAVLIATSTTYVILFPAMFILGLGWSTITILSGLSIRYVREEERSTAMGLHQSVYGFGMFFGPYLSGFIAEALGVRELFWVLLAVIIVAGIAGSWVIKYIEDRMEGKAEPVNAETESV